MSQKKRAMMIGLDGADPFVIDRMISQGKLPNFKRAIDDGCTHPDHAMIGVLPSVTPPNWASLGTGSWPRTHGVTCFFNHTLGKPLNVFDNNWDSRRVDSEFIWERFSKEGKKSVMLNYCEAWPPRFEDKNGIYIDGTGVVPFARCNIDFQKLIELHDGDIETVEKPHAMKTSSGDCVVDQDQYEAMLANSSENDERSDFDMQFDPMIDTPVGVKKVSEHHPDDDVIDKIKTGMLPPENWNFELPPSAKVAKYTVNDGLTRRYVVLTASDGEHYDTLTFYANRKEDKPLAVVKNKKWGWPVWDTFTDPKTGDKVKVAYGIRVINIKEDGSFVEFAITHVINVEDVRYSYPQSVGKALYEHVGPVLPFLKFGRHLTDCADVLVESFQMVADWHANATLYLLKEACPDWDLFYLHFHPIDLFNHWFLCNSLPGSCDNWQANKANLESIYEAADSYIGMIMDNFVDDNTSIIIASDHAAVPESVGDQNPGIGCLDAITTGVLGALGWTVTKLDENGNEVVDWTKTRAVCQRSCHIYINLKGRDPDGIVEPEDYKKTVDELIGDLYNYRHPDTGKRVVSFCMNREEMEIVGMGGPHCGDILVQLMPTYNLEHAFSPSTTTNEGYSMNNLCIMIGGEFKKHATIHRPVRVVDVVPTLCHVTDTPIPSNVEGGVVWQALKGFDEMTF